MHHEKTQRGNPHGLTINQHVFPAASIARFAQIDGFVLAFLKDQRKIIRCRPQNLLFCMKRGWNQSVEHGFMKIIEDEFQLLANRILDGSISNGLNPIDNKIITRFCVLCRLRAEERLAPSSDVQMRGILVGSPLPKKEEEILEKHGYIFARGATMLGRHLASIRIQFLLDRLCALEKTWAVVYSRNIEFVVPDSFLDIDIVPLSPNSYLVANQRGGEILADDAVEINRMAIQQSSKYYFARDFSKCGIDVLQHGSTS